MNSFAACMIAWQRQYGRHDLPWQSGNAYQVWVSEIMLQQTQVATVIPYYQRFLVSFPNIRILASASEEQVLAHWSGLGYYARGRNLHKTAQIIASQYGGEFPHEFEQILALPGIGRSTAAAICTLAFHQRHAILDGNVKRVFARYFGIEGWAGEKKTEQQMWQQAEAQLPTSEIAIYTQALMDMGATVCTRSKPDCPVCPVLSGCIAAKNNRVAELPAPRPRKAVPERSTTFLLLKHDNDILLEKRPGSGIWGGLWCPPQLDDGQELVEDYLQRNGMEVSNKVKLKAFTHTFTHFRLHITPVLLHLECKPDQVQQTGNLWLDVEDALQAAIPTPVRKVLRSI
jgi:A/G-specific adenine glycosylase